MSRAESSRAPPGRAPLGDATRRVNNSQHQYSQPAKPYLAEVPHHETLPPDATRKQRSHLPRSPSPQGDLQAEVTPSQVPSSPKATVAYARLSAISKEYQGDNSNRNSQISTTSTNASDGRRRKTHIGPWNLGKTLGKGATARVRLARHAITQQTAAIKIVQKKNAQLSQAGSLASLDRKDAAISHPEDNLRRMPYGIEREVAIMKLIEHPHILKLYDIWENRTEIYLVLEYVDDGELFDHISSKGRLPEEESLKYFRQVLSAIGYCHSFNICHRDLKPENILLNREGNVKIADFGMAALQQNPDHRLQTSCGSPHYAAPEVIRPGPYKGDKVDIWSMGIILFATLAGYLPFDHPNLTCLLATVQKGRYDMPPNLSPEASDLIYRMLQVNPRDRINISQIWRHPLLRKYDYLDNFGKAPNPQQPDFRNAGRPVLRRSEIDRELLRHLRSMWHTLEESQIIKLLLNEEPNEQKLFYSLLLRHREIQLENYVPDIGYSSSDYQHHKPLAQVKKLSTCQFTQTRSNGHGRQVSRFTVVSNVSKKSQNDRKSGCYTATETEETVQSYDPFKASRSHDPAKSSQVAYANVVIHRGRASLQESLGNPYRQSVGGDTAARVSSGSTSGISTNRTGTKKQVLAPPRVFVSRSSLASSTRSRCSTQGGARVASVQKRGVSFIHLRRGSISSQHKIADRFNVKKSQDHHSKHSEIINGDGDIVRAVSSPPISTKYIRSKKGPAPASQKLVSVPKNCISGLWHEDVRQLSSSLAKDCDEAFNRTSVASTLPTPVSSKTDGYRRGSETPVSSFDNGEQTREASPLISKILVHPISKAGGDRSSWESRPLPPPPARSESVNVALADARKKAEILKATAKGEESPGYLDRMVSHIDKLMQPSPLRATSDRRAASAPIPSKIHETAGVLPSIYESNREDSVTKRSNDFEKFMERERVKLGASYRITSTPQPSTSRTKPQYNLGDKATRRDPRAIGMIKVIESGSSSPPKPPAPLNIRKKSSHSQTYTADARHMDGSEDASVSGPHEQYPSAGNTLVFQGKEGRGVDLFVSENEPAVEKRKKANWFSRASRKSEDDNNLKLSSENANKNKDYSVVEPASAKKKSFGLGRLFGKRISKEDFCLTTPVFNIHEDNSSITFVEENRNCLNENSCNLKSRQIEPRQNWLARLFHVKPATTSICFSVSKRRARQEVVSLLREWKKYGVKDVIADKDRSVVFGKIGRTNYLQMKEVAFACEFMTVIEHGKKFPLSIARFTQEKGAQSSFIKIVETLETVLRSRGMIVDERKRRMMIKTLNAS